MSASRTDVEYCQWVSTYPSHDGLNPARVPCWLLADELSHTLGLLRLKDGKS